MKYMDSNLQMQGKIPPGLKVLKKATTSHEKLSCSAAASSDRASSWQKDKTFVTEGNKSLVTPEVCQNQTTPESD